MKKFLLSLTAILTTAFVHAEEKSTLAEWAKDPSFRWVSFSFNTFRTSPNIHVEIGPGVHFNWEFPWCWMMTYSDRSYISAQVDFKKEELEKEWFLNVKQLTSLGCRDYSPIAIDVNNVTIVDHFRPLVDGWRIDHFPLPANLLKAGENTIKIRLQNACTNYWIENMSLSPNESASVWLMDDSAF